MRTSKLKDNLTFEEFQTLAARKPYLEGKWIYRYEALRMDDESELPYPEFDIWITNSILFLSLDAAESYMHELIEADSEPDSFYCHTITQLPVGVEESEHGARWLYGPQGNLVDYSISSWTGDSKHFHFFGRPAERIRFDKGDIVEVWNEQGVRLMLMVAPEPSVESCWEIYRRCKEISENIGDKFYYCQDPSDDQCIVIDGPGYEYHQHVSPLRIMKPRFPIPDDIQKEMQGWLNALDKSAQDNKSIDKAL